MNIIIPIFFCAVFIGLFARRITPLMWGIFIAVTLAVMTKYWIKQ